MGTGSNRKVQNGTGGNRRKQEGIRENEGTGGHINNDQEGT